MKLLVFSDSHGKTEPMRRTILARKPDLVVHLGDHVRDADEMRRLFPQTAFVSVRGNCDLGSTADERAIFTLGSVQVFACHGHSYNVKMGLDALLNAGYFSGAKLLLYGHTHVRQHLSISGMEIVNPGAAHKSCALIELCEDTGEMRIEILDIA